MPDEPQTVRGSSGGEALGSVPLATFMSEQEKVVAARLAEVRILADTRWAEHKEMHAQRDGLVQRALEDRIEARDREDSLWRQSHAEAHRVERIERDRAVTAVDKRLEGMNELRDQINRERATFRTRDEARLAQEQMEKQIDVLTDRLRAIDVTIGNLQGRIAMAGIGLTILMFVVGIGARFLE